MTVVTAMALWSARRDGRPRACFLDASVVGAVAVLLPFGLADDHFRAIRLICYGLFGFLAATWAGCAWLLRRSHRRSAALFALGCLAIAVVAVDGFWIEPHWLEVSRIQLVSDKLNTPVKVALLADLQTDEIGDYERMVIERIVAEQPDLILLAGDYIQEWDSARHMELLVELRDLLNRCGFSAPLGVYAVRGNVDAGDWDDAFLGTDVTIVPRSQSFSAGDLLVSCLSMRDSFSTDVTVAEDERFQIVLGHCPNFALGDVRGDLLVAGHCHGGQVQVPWFGPLVTHARVPRSWAAGVTRLSGGRTLVVSRGVGMERGAAPRLRILCRPELIFLELLPKSEREASASR
ncbi:MAG TPA: metallophosphoesterase [Pirellulales bacterium]|nr:metallophosphoesterase [Pirellulales bacterium]